MASQVIGPTKYKYGDYPLKPIDPSHLGQRVIIESPFAGDTERNIRYARAAMRDSLMRGEYPLASHLLYTQSGILNDDIPDERQLGIAAGLDWGRFAQQTVVYTDLGISSGMEEGIKSALWHGRPVIYREIPNWDK